MNPRSIERYYDRLRDFEPLDPEEEVRLIERAQDESHPRAAEARRHLVQSNLRFVVQVARRYENRGLPLGDLIAEGNYGLVKAIGYFDSTRGFRFITYAVWWIRHAIQKALRSHSGAVAMPESRVRAHSQLENVRRMLLQQYEGEPTDAHLADELDWSEEEVRRARQEAAKDQHLEDPVAPGSETALGELLSQGLFEAPDRQLESESMRGALDRAVARLDEREAVILRRYYGIDRERGCTLGEIAEEFDLSRERIRQLKERALRRLRERYEAHELLV